MRNRLKRQEYRTTVTVPDEAYRVVNWLMKYDQNYKGSLSRILQMLIAKGARAQYLESLEQVDAPGEDSIALATDSDACFNRALKNSNDT